ncbi:histidine N-acetyltransferase-like [Oculina patagonica]
MQSVMKPLTFRLAQPGDFNEVVKLSEGIYNGHDYLPLTFHQWLKKDNSAVILAFSGKKLVGLQACFVVDDGRTLIRRAERIRAELRGRGLVRQLREYLRKYAKEQLPSLQRERAITDVEKVSSQDETKLFEYDVLSYLVTKNCFSLAKISTIKSNAVAIELCFSNIILSLPVTETLFPRNIVVINSCPFEPVRSHVDPILQECSELFVDKCADDFSPSSISFGTFSPRVKCVHWRVCVYTDLDDPVHFKAHLFCQFKRACEVISGDFIFVSFQDRSFTQLTRNVMEEQLQLKECDSDFSNKIMKLYERDLCNNSSNNNYYYSNNNNNNN